MTTLSLCTILAALLYLLSGIAVVSHMKGREGKAPSWLRWPIVAALVLHGVAIEAEVFQGDIIHFGFGFVRRDQVEAFEQFAGQRASRSRVENQFLMMLLCQSGYVFDRFDRNLELYENDLCPVQYFFDTGQVGRQQVSVGSRSDDNAVLGPIVHGDQGDSRRVFRVGAYIRSVDAFFFKQLAGLVAENVAADFADEGHLSTQSGDGDGLVGPFAAGIHQKRAAQNRFPRTGKVRAADYHIGIAAADHQNLLGSGNFCFHKD